MVRTKELGVKPFLFISLLFYKPVMSSQVIISSAKPCKQSEIIIRKQSKVKTSILSLPQPPLPPALLSEKVTDVWGPFVVHCICENIRGCHLFRLVSV